METGLYSQLTASEIRQLDVDWLVEEAKTPEPTAASPSPLTIILSPHTISETFEHFFRWSKADRHARSSWAGMVVWSLSAVTSRLTANHFFYFTSFLILWILATWLMTPILQLPIDDPMTRLGAAISFALASVAIPIIMALVTAPDLPQEYQGETFQRRKNLFLLKLTGAVVGFNLAALLVFFVGLGLSYVGTPASLWMWRIVLLAPLLMAHLGARRIPADRRCTMGN